MHALREGHPERGDDLHRGALLPSRLPPLLPSFSREQGRALQEEESSITHQWPLPAVPLPESLEDGDVLMQRILDDPDSSPELRHETTARLLNYPSTFRIRPVDGDAYLRLKKAEPRLLLWIKSKSIIGEDWRLNHCVAAFISDAFMIGTALLPHVAAGFKVPSCSSALASIASRSLLMPGSVEVGMVFSLDHSIWIHRHKFRIDDWMLYETESPIACLPFPSLPLLLPHPPTGTGTLGQAGAGR